VAETNPLTAPEARRLRVCRVCHAPIVIGAAMPAGWYFDFFDLLYPTAITLDYGREYAHTACLAYRPTDSGPEPTVTREGAPHA
jgi:hypothetical protein